MRLINGLLVVAVAALVVGYLLGSRPQAATTTAPPQKASELSQIAPASEAPETSAGTRARFDERAFWDLVSQTRADAGSDTGRQSELLEERLSRLPARQIVDFQRIRRRLDEGAYTWDLWGAAYVIEDGCSDDCFRDFRSYLISLGRDTYEAALRDPDSLAPVVQDAEEGDWENADEVAPDAYASATGHDFPVDDTDVSGDPRGEPWDDEAVEALVERYPGLAARFR